ncbi:HU family DNA-binding protein [Pseudonocardia sp. TRM90224]|uniref:HU family DNA-binding protein n=1 Tax=Pseudonocardia sp. TRM90224 TaxID=2812678 RepID=UPI001E65B6CF|nr:HU family DNA-binding protein [Pseudonocardia sp. TRM90224]
MNKTQLVDALAERLGDRRTAATAVDGLLETIVETVQGGDSVSITGFGVFEGRARAARTARNPRTGEPISISATTVPAFRPGATFRTAVGGGSTPAPATPAPAAKPASRRAKVTTSFTAAAPSKAAKNGSEKDDSKNGTEKNGTGKNGKDKTSKAKSAKADKSEKSAKADKGKKASKNKK